MIYFYQSNVGVLNNVLQEKEVNKKNERIYGFMITIGLRKYNFQLNLTWSFKQVCSIQMGTVPKWYY